jgi:ATP-dependent DNA helicase RecG
MSEFLDVELKFLQGVGPKKAEVLSKEINLNTYGDLLYYFPYKYVDRTKFHKVYDVVDADAHYQIVGQIRSLSVQGEGKKQRLTALFADATGTVELVWFSGIKYFSQTLKTGTDYILFGRPTEFNGRMNFPHPELELASAPKTRAGSLQAFYSTTERMKRAWLDSGAISKFMYAILQLSQGKIAETLPEKIISKHRLMPLDRALMQIHFPQNENDRKYAEFRLKFEELFWVQLKIIGLKFYHSEVYKGLIFSKVGDCFNRFYHEKLPFRLTGAQKKVIKEIRRDVGSGKQMNRLLQGDVGSGKTLVALMSALIALDNGFQACIMAPTEILATQHHAAISRLVAGLGIQCALLTGSTKAAERRVIHAGIETGAIHILVGTHTLIEDTVNFSNLGLAVIDEQHRFGVAQRAKLWKKNQLTPPHVLVMTATPIPRTLAMTLYGDLDVSVIDELPPGRKPIVTRHVLDSHRPQIYDFVRQQLRSGRQVYWVYPLIKESEKLDLRNLENGYELLQQVFPDFKLSMVHGKMKPAEKDSEMQRFKEGETHILVATTVIEVGVDVPNASVMVIESAERFGLSQLHQLRGRVGRGAAQSFCLLASSYKLGKDSRLRLETMVRTSDGFEIAETDLKLRGPGDIEGTQQSGLGVELRIAHLGHDGAILQLARDTATAILSDDPHLTKPENALLPRGLSKLKDTEFDWREIS